MEHFSTFSPLPNARFRHPEGRMQRRGFIKLTGAAGANLSLQARAQEARHTYRLGFLIPAMRTFAARERDVRRIPSLNGFVEGQNLVIVGSFGVTTERIADGVAAPAKAAPDAIVSQRPSALHAGLGVAARTIPLITISEDLISEGLDASLAKPGGNITGISLLSPELDDKHQDILIDAVPGVRRIAALADSTIAPKRHLQQQQEAARSRRVELLAFTFARPEEIVTALDEAKALAVEAINFLATPLELTSRGLILDRMAALRLLRFINGQIRRKKAV